MMKNLMKNLMKNIINNNSSDSSDCIYKKYTNFIKDTQLQLEPEKWYFKSNDNYTYMLEHPNLNGKTHLETIIEKFYIFFRKYPRKSPTKIPTKEIS